MTYTEGREAAFAAPSVYCPPDSVQADGGQYGMTVREFYAAAALTGLLVLPGGRQYTPEEAADRAFECADAMLARAARQ